MFDNIEAFYKKNHFRLIEDKSEGSLRPGKSFTKDVENCIHKFSDYYKEHDSDGISEDQLLSIIGNVDTNTRSQNLRVMREFGFMYELHNPTDSLKFIFTDVFKNFISSGQSARDYIFNILRNIASIDDLSMYLNLLLCTLREAYLYGQVILFKDSYEKFKAVVPDNEKRNYYRKRIFEVYGYSGRDKKFTDDVYSPNLSYMSRAELENLGLLIKTTEKIDNMENLVLTVKGYELLMQIDNNLGSKQQDEMNQSQTELVYYTGIKSEETRNQIVFGAPGTGKSFELNKKKNALLGLGNESNYERVTFHPDYSYANFVGSYKPVMVCSTKDPDKKDIAYQYVPGPFMRILVEALKNAMSDSPKPYLLIIEEINRANVAAVFGDVFQLLDRNKNGVSEYEISTTIEMRTYLSEKLCIEESDIRTLKIPDNLFIWATMNSADQGVFPMDTAFKRRWDFSYLGIDDAEEEMSEEIKNKVFVLGQGAYSRLVTWNNIRKAINDELSSEAYNINEDKLLGPYFISKSVLEGTLEGFVKAFKNKVLMYLFDDAVKQKRKAFFSNCKDDKKGVRYSDICDAFDTKGIFIFPDEIAARFTNQPSESEEDHV